MINKVHDRALRVILNAQEKETLRNSWSEASELKKGFAPLIM